MAGVTVINPRRSRRGRRKKAKATRGRRRRTRRNPFAASNPRRRRRVRRARSSVRRRRRGRSNPRIGGNLTQNLTNGALVAAGIVGSRYLSGWISKMVPAEWSAGPNAALVRIGTKAAVGVALPLLLKPILKGQMRSWANWIAVGGFAAVALDLLETYVPGLADYEMSGYVESGGDLVLGQASEVEEVESLGAGNMFDTVYG